MEVIRRKREALGMTQQELAHAARVNVSTVGAIETGTRKPSLPALTRIARVLVCGLGDLIKEA